MSLSKQPKHNTNPYKKYGIDNIVFNAGATEHLVVEPDSGEVFGLRKMNKNGTKRVDRHTFVKVYVDSLDKIRDLSKPAYKLFCYLLKNIELKKDFIFLIEADVTEWCGFSDKAKYYAAVNELINTKFIARSTDNKKFFINPNLFFNGDRTTH